MAKTKTVKKSPARASAPRPSPSRRKRLVTEIVGWYGAVAILAAYGLASFGAVSVHDTPYLILNLTGALGILTVATAKHVRQSMVVNAFWAAMAAIALLKIIFQV